MKHKKSFLALIICSFTIFSCGGGGSSSNIIPIQTPSVGAFITPVPTPTPMGPVGNISGKIIDSYTKLGIQGIRVEVRGVNPKVIAYTDASGKYTLSKVPQGRQVIGVVGSSYATVNAGNITVDVIANNTTPVTDIAVISSEKDKTANSFVKILDGFTHPRGLAIDRNNSDLYVVDVVGINSILPIQKDRTEIKKITSDGGLLDNFASRWFSKDTTDIFRLIKGGKGIGLDAGGNIYVVDPKDNSVKKYGPNGKYISKLDKGLGEVFDVAVLTTGDIAISDPSSSRVVLMDATGIVRVDNLFAKFPSDGVRGVAVDQSDNIYVIDAAGKKGEVIKKFDKYGFRIPLQFGSIGSLEPGSFNDPTDLAIDNRNGDIYVVDSGNNRVQRFSAEGNYLSEFGQFGIENGSFNTPWGIAIDKEGYVYVSDPKNSRVQKFSPARAIN
ncbi:MAG: hypothetical protein U0457_03080 [Candidatus Sericytochromatia bacterium]